MRRPTVLLADDHRVVVEGLVNLLTPTCDLVGTVEDGRALVEAAIRLDPDIVVSDISLPLLNGIDALVQLKKKRAKSKVIFLTMHRDAAYATRALEAGAAGFVIKHSASSELMTAIREVLKGNTYVTPILGREPPSKSKAAQTRTRDAASGLTPRQRDVLRLVAAGRSSSEIASALNISPRTVEFHRNKLKHELHLRNQSELVRFAIKHGIAVVAVWVPAVTHGTMV